MSVHVHTGSGMSSDRSSRPEIDVWMRVANSGALATDHPSPGRSLGNTSTSGISAAAVAQRAETGAAGRHARAERVGDGLAISHQRLGSGLRVPRVDVDGTATGTTTTDHALHALGYVGRQH